MVRLSRIYTKTGDDGSTGLGDGTRLSKHHLRIAAYGTSDEVASAIGLALAYGAEEPVAGMLRKVQNDLFDVGADLCTPVVEDPEHPPLRVDQEYVERLEAACDEYNGRLEPLRSFVLPGGTVAAAQLHVARTVVRRAERSTWGALDTYHGGMNPLTATYLNRLSDLLFILARVANLEADGDVLWQPGANR
jgi:cob(I)alamin adenosyltransferase